MKANTNTAASYKLHAASQYKYSRKPKAKYSCKLQAARCKQIQIQPKA